MSDDVAKCRGCGRVLVDYNGQPAKPYYTGNQNAYHPKTGDRTKICYYGGFVCSRSCDHRACLDLEQSMPGHDYRQTSLGCYSAPSMLKWDEQ